VVFGGDRAFVCPCLPGGGVTAVARKIEGVQPEARQARPCNQTVSPSVKEGHDLSLMVRQICTDGASRQGKRTVSLSVKGSSHLSLMVRQICTDGASRPRRLGINTSANRCIGSRNPCPYEIPTPERMRPAHRLWMRRCINERQREPYVSGEFRA
jgi:hypothetical protein